MNEDKITNFFFEIASLRRLTRSHRQLIEGVSDNISDHSFRVAIIGMILAQLEGADTNKVVKMCLFHDIAEARTGDANHLNKHYLELHEGEAVEDQMEDLPIGTEILNLLQEYNQRQSNEAIVAKDADLLDQMVLQQEYFYNDQNNGKRWQEYTQQKMRTESGKTLANRIKKSNPFEWLYHSIGKKRGTRV
jgi:putative hydrolase of HD superfamily